MLLKWTSHEARKTGVFHYIVDLEVGDVALSFANRSRVLMG